MRISCKRSSRSFIVIMASMAGSERDREHNHVLSSSSNTISEIEGGNQIQRDGDLDILVPMEITPEVAATVSAVTSGSVTMAMLPSSSDDINKVDIEACLKLNIDAQTSLQEQLSMVNHALEENQSKMRELQDREMQAAIPKKSPKIHFSLRKFQRGQYFIDASGFGPPPNDQMLDTQRRKEINYYGCKLLGTEWSKEDKRKLTNGVRQQNIEIMSQPYIERLANTSAVQELKRLQDDINQISQLPDAELLVNIEGIDWDKIAEEQFQLSRTGADLLCYWQSVLHPLLNKQSWTREEDKKLMRLAKHYSGRHWQQIALELGTNRSPYDCILRYQQCLNPVHLKRSWTADEDQMLKEAVQKHGAGNWILVASEIPGRTGQQCMHRWQKALMPGIKKGRWTAQEDEQLKQAVALYGAGNWSKIKLGVPSRTDAQCRERWVNVLDAKVKKGEWTREEDEKLLQLCQEYQDNGGLFKWSEIASKMASGRTDSMCSRRWAQLNEASEVTEYFAKAMKKNALMMPHLSQRGRRRSKTKITVEDMDDDFVPEETKQKIKKLSVKVKKWKKRQALGLPRGGRPRKPKMLDDEEEEEVEMSEEYSDQEEYMEYSIVQHEVEDVIGDLEDHDGVIRTTKARGRPKRRHSEGVGNHSSKRPRTASVEVTLPTDATTSYNLPSTSSSIMSEVVNVILAQVASQQRQQQQQQLQQHQSHDIITTDELQENVEVVTEPTNSNDLIIIENSLDSTNTVEVWAGGEGGGANMTGEVNQILERIGVGQSGETIQDTGEGDVVVTEATEEVVSQEIITEETPCEESLTVTAEESLTITAEEPLTAEESLTVSIAVSDKVTNKSTNDNVITCNDHVASDQIVGHDQATSNQVVVDDQVVVNNEVASGQIMVDDQVRDQVPSDHVMADNQVVVSDQVVNDQVASDQIVVDNQVASNQADQIASDQVVVGDQVVVNDHVVADLLVSDQVASDQIVVDNQVASNQIASDQVVVSGQVASDQIVVHDQVASNQVVVNDQIASDQRLGDDQVVINNGGAEVDKSTTPDDNITATPPSDNITLCNNDDITTIDNDDHKA